MSPHDVQVLYRNLMCAAYLTMKQGSAASCWRLLTSYARFCEGKLPTCQDSDDIFRECAGVIDEKLVRACISDLQRSRYWALSVDEKDRMMIFLISYFDTESGKLATLPLGYKDLSGFEAADLFLIVERFVAEHGLNKQDLLCFSADGASVMGTRRSQGDMRGDNLAKRLQEFAGHPLIVTHCAAHRLQLCVSACWSDEYFKDLVPWRKQTNFSSRSYPTPDGGHTWPHCRREVIRHIQESISLAAVDHRQWGNFPWMLYLCERAARREERILSAKVQGGEVLLRSDLAAARDQMPSTCQIGSARERSQNPCLKDPVFYN